MDGVSWHVDGEAYHVINHCEAFSTMRIQMFGTHYLTTPPKDIMQVLEFAKKAGIAKRLFTKEGYAHLAPTG